MNRGRRAAKYRSLLGSPFQIVLLLATLAFAGYAGCACWRARRF